jgi:hypothetical protein
MVADALGRSPWSTARLPSRCRSHARPIAAAARSGRGHSPLPRNTWSRSRTCPPRQAQDPACLFAPRSGAKRIIDRVRRSRNTTRVRHRSRRSGPRDGLVLADGERRLGDVRHLSRGTALGSLGFFLESSFIWCRNAGAPASKAMRRTCVGPVLLETEPVGRLESWEHRRVETSSWIKFSRFPSKTVTTSRLP